MKEKESFVFYRSFAESINCLPANFQLPLYKAITAYALDLEVPDFGNYEDKFVLEALWAGIKPQLDANYQRYLNGCKGGAPKGSRNNPNGRRGKGTNQELTGNKPNDNVNENDNVNGNVVDGVIGFADSPSTHRRKFVKPSPDEVKAYCREKGYSVDADRFCDHYESNGWMVGKNPMKDWRAAVRIWARTDKNSQSVNTIPQATGTIIGPDEILKMMKDNG